MANDLSLDHLNHLARRVFGDNLPTDWLQGTGTMKTDIVENDDNYVVTIDLPGLNKNDIRLNYSDGLLVVRATAKQKHDETNDQNQLIRSERHYGTVERQYALPDVDEAKVTAAYQDGVLTITLPKTADAQKHHIEIN
ncbi:hypothetical protein IV38_GL001197 [Lactobacillus selangorensis]|uniref:SHSP domain-containing protein n=1 Tax=Lactobacillus selangorensis TaxID=81857 RepID=A0A0R2FK69_9LACO|nr:Hsp20/alpha crystallin family protein [Lactobacillus selangorensis]KRN28984.1 hypothetical protein IV38_GL001197 [Lactobacillus selangorensis]KRN32606.1 hypothetical protein IV40_GL000656 [Lactobacillus selangorensis]